ncbi:OmpA family protein [Maribacter polysiphoniae]|uniref:OmpA family protein n=1 Tax=Maribacter polysiphoniae TaxID=429344 RepID=UPI002357942D|nr:OmpA family protein [Maribacter polysiphoniae]
MRTKALLLCCFMILANSFAQEEKSKADILFYGYDYKSAIVEYKKEMSKAPLKNSQLLNMADAYYKLGDYNGAAKIYLDIHKKDTIMSGLRFNMMLQSLAKTSDVARVRTFLGSKSNDFANELVENADFNYNLLDSSESENAGLQTININANSPQADFAPSFYNDKLLFSSGRGKKSKEVYKPSGEAYLDIYVGRMRSDGNVLNANPFIGLPENGYHEATPYYSQELDKLFYVTSNTHDGELRFDDNGKNALAIAMSGAQGDQRFLLKDLSVSFYYPFYEAKTSRLYFAANFEGGYGGTDIYYVVTNNGQIMSEPRNLGPKINSPGNEIAPYIFQKSLYFSSDVFYGMGGMDMYKAKMYADGSFGIPINLGKGINSTDDDFGLILRQDGSEGLLGYFSSNRKGGKGNDDIYSFKIKEELGLKTLSLKGRVVNLKTNSGVIKAQVQLINKAGDVITEVYANEEGEFRFEIPWEDQVTVKASKERYSNFLVTYNENDYTGLEDKGFQMGLSMIDDILTEKEGKEILKLQKFYFARGRADITAAIATELDKVVEAVQRFPLLQLGIETYTNSKGAKATNLKLSQKRADAIRSYLVGKGVADSNIVSAMGFGEENLVNKCADGVYCLDFLHKQNDRTLIVVKNAQDL